MNNLCVNSGRPAKAPKSASGKGIRARTAVGCSPRTGVRLKAIRIQAEPLARLFSQPPGIEASRFQAPGCRDVDLSAWPLGAG